MVVFSLSHFLLRHQQKTKNNKDEIGGRSGHIFPLSPSSSSSSENKEQQGRDWRSQCSASGHFLPRHQQKVINNEDEIGGHNALQQWSQWSSSPSLTFSLVINSKRSTTRMRSEVGCHNHRAQIGGYRRPLCHLLSPRSPDPTSTPQHRP